MSTVPSLLRYARNHGLCFEFGREDLLQKLDAVDLVDESPVLPKLPDFIPPHEEPPADLKLQVSQQATKLLFSATTQPPKPRWRDLLRDHRQLQELKVEQPLLLTDHERDVRRFLPKRNLELEDIEFPMEVLDDDHDEGFSWPAHIRELHAQWDKEITHKKLQVSRESLRLLNRIQEDAWTQDHHNTLLRELATYRKIPKSKLLSLPLIPENPPSEAYVPSSPPLKLSLASDPSILMSLPTESPLKDLSYDDFMPSREDILPEVKSPEYYPLKLKYKDCDLVGVDAGKPSSSRITKEETEKNENDAMEHKPDHDLVLARSLISHLNVPQLAPYSSAETYPLPSLPVADKIMPVFADNKIHKRSTTAIPPFCEGKAFPTKSIAFSERLEVVIPNILHGIRISTNLELLTEDIGGKEYIPSVPKDVVRSHQMLWKPDKLSWLKDEDNEKDLVLEYSADLCEKVEDDGLNVKDNVFVGLSQISQRSTLKLKDPLQAQLAKEEPDDSYTILRLAKDSITPSKRKPLEDIINKAKRPLVAAKRPIPKFSASGLLCSFLGTRHNQMATSSEQLRSTEHEADVLVPGTPDDVGTGPDSRNPYIAALQPSRTIFFSISQLQQNQPLLKFFEAWASDALNIIYRELDVLMLLSPRHAVVISNLQALTQRPLPGQSSEAKSALHDQVSHLSRGSGFEVLFVLISIPDFASNHQATMLSFTAYCDNLSGMSPCQIMPIYILSGENELHLRIAKLVFQCASETRDIFPHEDETIWERFLVRAGMNSFAAQVVLGQLKDDGSGRPWGLRAFVEMSPAERNQRFGTIIGRRVLESVSRKVYGGFGSAEQM